MNIYKGVALFAGGVLFGSAGFKLLSSKDAKKAYTHATAAALRMKEAVMETGSGERCRYPCFGQGDQ